MGLVELVEEGEKPQALELELAVGILKLEEQLEAELQSHSEPARREEAEA